MYKFLVISSSRRILSFADTLVQMLMRKLLNYNYKKRNFPEAINPPLYFLAKLIAVACLSFIVTACGQTKPESQTFLIGVINPNKGTQSMNKGFIGGLADQGYLAGKNTTFISALKKTEIDKALLEMLEKNADLIFTVTTPATKKAIAAAKTKDIPVIFALHDPVSSGVIKNLSTVKENITGVQIRGSVPMALDWLLKVSPGIKSILVPVKFDTPASRQSLDDLHKAVLNKDINLVLREINSPEDIPLIFQNMPENTDAVFLLHSIFISSHTEIIVREAAKRKLPVGGGTSTYHKGALITFGVNGSEVGKQASLMAHQILQGVKTENIPVETAEFYLGVNLKAAHIAETPISNTILSSADYIIPYKKKESQ